MKPLIIEREKIQQAKDKLGDQNAFIMAKELNIEDFNEKDLKSCCPYHLEDTASFIYNKKNHTFHCFGCQKTVDIIDVFMQKGATYAQAASKLFDLAGMHHSFGELNVQTKYQYKYPKEVNCNNKDMVYEYLAKRKISKEVVDYADVRQDDRGNIVFNYYDTNDVLTMVKYRPSHKIEKTAKEPKCWCQPGADTTPLLFNMNRVNAENPLLICEGELDCLAAIESGYTNTVSVPLGAGNFHWIEENWEWLDQFDSIIICADNDDPGIKMQKECIYRLGSWRTKVVDIPYSVQFDDTKTLQVKDLNEILYFCGKQAVIDLILNAKDSPIPSLIDFSDVTDIDMSDIDGIYTNIEPLDHELMRMFYGSVTLLTGTPGSGKSSFLYQMIAESVEQNNSVWLFSKEMPVHMSKNWLNPIIAGRRHIKEYQTEKGTVFYRVTNEAKRQIDAYYRGKIYMYRDGWSNDLDEIKSSMVDCARKNGSKFFILDNLMTINLHANDDNKYDKQTELLTWLIDFATKFNVCVVLVAHPRKKQDINMALTKYDISGSSNMINLAHRSLGLRRVTDQEKEGVPNKNGQGWHRKPIPYDVILTVIKDRLRGREGKEIGLYYDQPTRRFFTNPKEFNRQYSWDETNYDDVLPYPIEETESEIFGELFDED